MDGNEQWRRRKSNHLKTNIAEFYIEKESLVARGLDLENLVEELELVDSRKVSELLAANSLQLIF